MDGEKPTAAWQLRPRILKLDSGGEKHLPFAKQQLFRMYQAGVYGIRQLTMPDGAVIQYRRQFGQNSDWISITAQGGVFIVYPYMKTPTTEVVQQTSEYLTLPKTVAATVPAGLTNVSRHPWRGVKRPVVSVRTSAFGPIGYLVDGKIVSTTWDSSLLTAAATPAGLATPLIGIRASTLLKDDANTTIGTLTSSAFTFDVSRDGTKLLYQDGSLNYRLATLNYTLLPSNIVASDVAATVPGLASPYGTNNSVVNSTRNVACSSVVTINSASTVVAGQSTLGVVQVITGATVNNVTSETLNVSFPGSATQYDRLRTVTGTQTVTLPSGAVLTATTGTTVSSSFNGVSGTGTQTSSASGQTETLTVLWADASMSCALVQKSSVAQSGSFSGSVVFPDSVAVSLNFSGTTTTTNTFYWLAGATAAQVGQVVLSPVTGVSMNPGTTPNSTSSSNITTNITSPPFASIQPRTANSLPDSTAALTNDGKSYIGQFTPTGGTGPVLFGSVDPRPAIIARMREIIAARAPSPSNNQILADIDAGTLTGYQFGLTDPAGTLPVACV